MVLTILPMRRNSPRKRAAVDLDRHRLRKIALRHRADDARNLGGRLRQIVDQFVDRAQLCIPAADCATYTGPLIGLAFLADDFGKPSEFFGDLLVAFDNFVEGIGDFGVVAIIIGWQANRKIAFAKGIESAQKFALRKFLGNDRCGHIPP